jgi:hypothetical protein
LPAVTALPRTALRNDGNVMVVDGERRARLKPVAMLQRTNEQVWVQGLDEGDRVIVAESAATVAGMEVMVSDSTRIAGGAY